MPQIVTEGARIKCLFGMMPSVLQVEPETGSTSLGLPVATVEHHVSELNIPSFGDCTCPDNPEVIAATAAALGVFTPAPCVPVTLTPWEPGAEDATIAGIPMLTMSSSCECTWGGVIVLTDAGESRASGL